MYYQVVRLVQTDILPFSNGKLGITRLGHYSPMDENFNRLAVRLTTAYVSQCMGGHWYLVVVASVQVDDTVERPRTIFE